MTELLTLWRLWRHSLKSRAGRAFAARWYRLKFPPSFLFVIIDGSHMKAVWSGERRLTLDNLQTVVDRSLLLTGRPLDTMQMTHRTRRRFIQFFSDAAIDGLDCNHVPIEARTDLPDFVVTILA
jgi:hypothetical protein